MSLVCARPTAAAYVDLENLCGRWWELPENTIAEHVADVLSLLPRSSFVHIAGAPALIGAAAPALPCGKHLMISPREPDAADEQLADCLRTHAEDVPEVWIMSGDHAFADVARSLRASGHLVQTAALVNGLNAQLAAASHVVHMVRPPLPPAAWTGEAA